jgi:hypothetical protein
MAIVNIVVIFLHTALITSLKRAELHDGFGTAHWNSAVQDAFLDYFCDIFGNYRKFWVEDTTTATTVFDKESMLKSVKTKQQQQQQQQQLNFLNLKV